MNNIVFFLLNNSKKDNVMIFILIFIAIIIALLLIYSVIEKKKKKDIRKKFKKFTESYEFSKNDLRNVERIKIPQRLNVILTLTDNEYFGLKSKAIDISLKGFAVKPAFPLKLLPLNLILNNVLVSTPINNFVIKRIRAVRTEHQINKRLLAYEIIEIEENHKIELEKFVLYLSKYLKKV